MPRSTNRAGRWIRPRKLCRPRWSRVRGDYVLKCGFYEGFWRKNAEFAIHLRKNEYHAEYSRTWIGGRGALRFGASGVQRSGDTQRRRQPRWLGRGHLG